MVTIEESIVMSYRILVVTIIGLQCLWAAFACSEEPAVAYDLPPISMEARYVKVGLQNEAAICPSWLKRMDAYVLRIRSLWKLSAVSEEKFAVYVMDAARTQEICKGNFSGCFIHRGGTGFIVVKETSMFSASHELVHAILEMDAHLSMPPFYNEGMAETFGDGGCRQIDQDEKPELSEISEDVNASAEVRRALKSFFKYLFERYGWEKLLAWGRLLRPTSGFDDISTSFAEVFDLEIEDAWSADWAPFAVPYFSECLADPVPWQEDGAVWRYTFDACSASIDYTNDGSWTEEAVLEIDEEALYRFDFSAVGEGVYLISCDLCEEGSSRVDFHRPLSPGRYAIRMYANPDIERPIEVLVEPYVQCDPFGNDCKDGEKCAHLIFEDKIACAPLAEPPVEIGERCEAPAPGESDPCVASAVCEAGVCRPLCEGDKDAPICPSDHVCLDKLETLPFPGACFQTCSPWTANDCKETEYCKGIRYNDESFDVCAVTDGEILLKGASCDLFSVENDNPFAVSKESECTSLALCAGGFCAEKCDPDAKAPSCPSGTECALFSTDIGEDAETFGVCMQACSPLNPDCPTGASCVQVEPWAKSPRYFCSAHSPKDDFPGYGDDACLLLGCGEGLYCTAEDTAVPTDDVSFGFGVCTALCDPKADSPNDSCPDANLGQRCIAIEDDPTLGFCTIDPDDN